MDIKQSQSWKNMEDALNREALAYAEYMYYSKQASTEGYTQISNLLAETANNELQHGKLLFKKLHDGKVPDTLTCLKLAFKSEEEEWGNYPIYADKAREEGFDDVADLFDGLTEIEKSHGERFQTLIDRINNGEVFCRKEIQVWYCTVCGHLHIGTEPPDVCPVCDHDKGHFEIRATNW